AARLRQRGARGRGRRPGRVAAARPAAHVPDRGRGRRVARDAGRVPDAARRADRHSRGARRGGEPRRCGRAPALRLHHAAAAPSGAALGRPPARARRAPGVRDAAHAGGRGRSAGALDLRVPPVVRLRERRRRGGGVDPAGAPQRRADAAARPPRDGAVKRLALLIALAVAAADILPLGLVLKQAFTPERESFAWPPTWVPRTLTLENVRLLADAVDLRGGLALSVLVAALTVASTLAIALPAAWAAARQPGVDRGLDGALVVARVFPTIALVFLVSWDEFGFALLLQVTNRPLPPLVYYLTAFGHPGLASAVAALMLVPALAVIVVIEPALRSGVFAGSGR